MSFIRCSLRIRAPAPSLRGSYQNRPLRKSNQATRGQNRPVPASGEVFRIPDLLQVPGEGVLGPRRVPGEVPPQQRNSNKLRAGRRWMGPFAGFPAKVPRARLVVINPTAAPDGPSGLPGGAGSMGPWPGEGGFCGTIDHDCASAEHRALAHRARD